MADKQYKKSFVGLSLSWVAGVIFILFGLGALFSLQLIVALVSFIMGSVLLPPAYKFISGKFKLELSKGIKIVIIVVGLIVIGIIAVTEETKEQIATGDTSKQETKAIDGRQFVSEELASLHFNYFHRTYGLTDLQKEEMWKDYKGKYVEWEGYVHSVDDTFTGLKLLMNYMPMGQYTIGTDASITMRGSEKEKLLKYSEGDPIKIQAQLVDYHNILTMFSLKDGVVVE